MHSLTSPACCLTTLGFLFSLHFWLFGAILQMAGVQSGLLAIILHLSYSSHRPSAGYFLQASWWWHRGLRLPGKQLGTARNGPAEYQLHVGAILGGLQGTNYVCTVILSACQSLSGQVEPGWLLLIVNHTNIIKIKSTVPHTLKTQPSLQHI